MREILQRSGEHLLLVDLAVAFAFLIGLLIGLLDPCHVRHEPAHVRFAGHHQL